MLIRRTPQVICGLLVNLLYAASAKSTKPSTMKTFSNTFILHLRRKTLYHAFRPYPEKIEQKAKHRRNTY
jgi:hypothetical protein